MKEWFDSLQPRERQVLIAGAVAFTLISIYFLIWEPLVTNKQRLEKSTQQQHITLAWMQEAAKEVKQLRASSAGGGRITSGQSLLGVIDRTAKRNKLGDSVKRVQPDGTSSARVWLENAKFDTVVRWLEQLQRKQGIAIESTMIEKQNEPGLVNARIVLKAAAE